MKLAAGMNAYWIKLARNSSSVRDPTLGKAAIKLIYMH